MDDMNQNVMRRFERFMERVRASDLNAAGEEFGRLCTLARRGNLRISNRVLAACAEAFIDMFWQLHDFGGMLRVAREAEQAFGKDPEWAFARGEALFNLGRFDEASAELEPLTHEEFDEPMVYYLLACIAERRGDEDQARRLFEAANRLDASSFRLPVPVTEREAIAQYEQCMAELPDAIAWSLREVPIYVDALPSDELIQSLDPPLDPLLMGVFMGQPRGEGESSWPSDQPRIVLFHKNIAKSAGDQEALEEELRKTLFHEVGHALGFDEDQLEEMGLA